MCGEYVVEEPLGYGGFAWVYAARHRVLGRRMAVKVLERELASSPRGFVRFLWEARTASRVRHPNVVEVVDFGRLFDGRPYLVMERLDGETLDDRLARCHRLDLATTVGIVDALASALSAVHAAGIVHRDLKPANVFLCGATDHVKLLDFGIAKLVRPEPHEHPPITTVNSRMGTPVAITPEVIRGEQVDARTDVYGLGVTLYRMLTGRWPFASADDAELERLHLVATPVTPSRFVPVPPAVDHVVARALAKEPRDRHASAAAFATALREASGPGATAALPARAESEAVACHLEITPRRSRRDTPERVAAILDIAGAAAVRRGWGVTAQTPAAMLIAAAAPPRTLADARALADELLVRTRRMTGGDVEVTATAHADRGVVCQRTTRVVGGRITDPRSWRRRGAT